MVPLRFNSVSQPTAAVHSFKRSGGTPNFFKVVELVVQTAISEPSTGFFHSVAVRYAEEGDHDEWVLFSDGWLLNFTQV